MLLTAVLCAPDVGAQVVGQLTPASPLDSVVSASRVSGFRIVGLIRQRNAVTTGSIQRTPFTSTVLVDTVLAAPRSVRRLGGRVITVILRDTVSATPGARFYFLASAVQFDTGTVLREEGRFPMPTNTSLPDVEGVIASADSAILSRAIAVRANGAATIVVGRVTAVDSTPVALPPNGYRGEHRPGWRIATVRVGRQIPIGAGVPPGPLPNVRVLFAGSRDAMFVLSPRVAAGDSVILILRPVSDISPRIQPFGVSLVALFALLHRVDVQPPSNEALVTAAVR